MKDGILRIKGTPGNALASYLDGGTVLVDSDGTVMAVNPTAEEVDRLLAERFGAAQ